MKNDLQMKSTISDYSFFLRKVLEKLVGLTITYVVDTMSAGTK